MSIAKTAIIDPSTTFGENNTIDDFVIFRPSVGGGAIVGNNNIFKVRTTISGGTKIGNNCYFGPHSVVLHEAITGFHDPVLIMHGAYIGAGAIIMPGVTIGRGVIIGAGAVVTKNCMEPRATYVGCPARRVNND